MRERKLVVKSSVVLNDPRGYRIDNDDDANEHIYTCSPKISRVLVVFDLIVYILFSTLLLKLHC